MAGLRLQAVTPIVKSIFHSKKTFSHRGSTFALKVYHYLNSRLHLGMNVLCVSPKNHPLSELFPQNLLSADGRRLS